MLYQPSTIVPPENRTPKNRWNYDYCCYLFIYSKHFLLPENKKKPKNIRRWNCGFLQSLSTIYIHNSNETNELMKEYMEAQHTDLTNTLTSKFPPSWTSQPVPNFLLSVWWPNILTIQKNIMGSPHQEFITETVMQHLESIALLHKIIDPICRWHH